MILLDLNVLLYAFSPTFGRHVAVKRWLEQKGRSDDPVLLPDVVLAGFIRIVTGGKLTVIAEPLDQTLAFCDALLSLPACRIYHAGERHWHIFRSLCSQISSKGNLVTDTFIAAMAIEANAELISFDTDFHRFPGLRIGSID